MFSQVAGEGTEGGFLKAAEWELAIISWGVNSTALEIVRKIIQKPKESRNKKCVAVSLEV